MFPSSNCLKKKKNVKSLSFMIFIENSAIERKLVFTSKTCKIWTTWPILMKFWYKKRQSMLFKRQSVWNPRYVASLGKSLTESGISGWWPGRYEVPPLTGLIVKFELLFQSFVVVDFSVVRQPNVRFYCEKWIWRKIWVILAKKAKRLDRLLFNNLCTSTSNKLI